MAISAKKLAGLVDQYYTARQNRLAEAKKVEKLEDAEKALKAKILTALQDQKTKTVGGSIATAEVVYKKFPVISDKELFEKFAKKKGNEDLIKHTKNDAAIKARWENDVVIPGIKSEEVVSLSITKV